MEHEERDRNSVIEEELQGEMEPGDGEDQTMVEINEDLHETVRRLNGQHSWLAQHVHDNFRQIHEVLDTWAMWSPEITA